MKIVIPLALVLVAALSQNSCRQLEPKTVDKSKHELDGPYSGILTKKSSFVISSNKLIGTKTVLKAAAQDSPALSSFKNALHPKLRQYCGQCHAGQNAIPFASPGVDLAFQTARQYVAKDPEASPLIKNVRASHNGVTPAWADELAPLVKDLADKS